MKNKALIVRLLLCSLLLFSTGCVTEEATSSKAPEYEELPLEAEDFSANSNEWIKPGEVRIIPQKTQLNHAYDHLSVEIVNHSSYPFSWYNEYNIFEEREGVYTLLDDDDDGFTYKRKTESPKTIIPPGDVLRVGLYLGQIFDGSYTRCGNYIIRVPIHEGLYEEISFEITDQYLSLDTGLSIGLENDVVNENREEAFCYYVQNDTESPVEVTLVVQIARFSDGEWNRLPFSKEYWEVHYNASLWGGLCASHAKWEGQFRLSLSQMLEAELLPGKYRIEKEMLGDWYFFEFEIK